MVSAGVGVIVTVAVIIGVGDMVSAGVGVVVTVIVGATVGVGLISEGSACSMMGRNKNRSFCVVEGLVGVVVVNSKRFPNACV